MLQFIQCIESYNAVIKDTPGKFRLYWDLLSTALIAKGSAREISL